MRIELYIYTPDGEGGVDIEVKDYDTLTSPVFAPEVDITGNSMPVNELTVDVVTTDDLSAARQGAFYDDLNQLWFRGDVTFAGRIDENHFRVRLSSMIYYLEYIDMEEIVYQNANAGTVIASCFSGVQGYYTIDSAIAAMTVTGYCPAQTARERLTWVCFVLGAVVISAFREDVHIQPISAAEKLIPLEQTFWRPKVDFDDWVTGVSVTAFTFAQAQTDEELQSNTSYMFPLPWVATTQTYSFTNPDAPEYAPENIVALDELYLVDRVNALTLLTRISEYWFNRQSVEMDCVNNRQFMPGDKVTCYIDGENLVTGYVRSADFSFGMQARSRLHITLPVERESAALIVIYRCDGKKIQQERYVLPVGYEFSTDIPYLDITKDGKRTIYRPLNETLTVTVQSGGQTVYVDCAVALELEDGILTVISVDSVTDDGQGTVIIG